MALQPCFLFYSAEVIKLPKIHCRQQQIDTFRYGVAARVNTAVKRNII